MKKLMFLFFAGFTLLNIWCMIQMHDKYTRMKAAGFDNIGQPNYVAWFVMIGLAAILTVATYWRVRYRPSKVN